MGWNKGRCIQSRKKRTFSSDLTGFRNLVLSIPVISILDVEGVSWRYILFMVFGSILLYQLGSMRIGLRMLGRADEEALALVVDRILFISSIFIAVNVGPNIPNLAIAFVTSSILSFSYTYWRYHHNSPESHKLVEYLNRKSFDGVLPLIFAASPFVFTILVPSFWKVDKFIIAWSEGVVQVAYFNIT